MGEIEGKHQAGDPCPECGSYHRIGNNCNVCGEYIIEPETETLKMQAKPMKRLWNKKLKRYLTQDEIKKGMKGG